MKPSDKDRRLDKIISRAAGEAKKAVPNFAQWLQDHPTAVKRLTSLRGTNLRSYGRKGSEPLLLRSPWLARALAVAAVFLLGVSCLACFVLARDNRTLRRNLLVARHQIAMNNRQQQIVEAQNGQQQAISDLHVRVRELEERVQRGISPRMIRYSESPYYEPEWPHEL